MIDRGSIVLHQLCGGRARNERLLMMASTAANKSDPGSGRTSCS